MITKVLAVYDSKALMYKAPIFVPAVGAGIRAFSDACNDPQIDFCKHPSDYILYHIGDFDDCSGQFVNVIPPAHLGVGSDYVQRRSVGSSVGNVPVVVEESRVAVDVNGHE